MTLTPLFDRHDCITDDRIITAFADCIALYQSGDEGDFTAACRQMFRDFPIDVYGHEAFMKLSDQVKAEMTRIDRERRAAAVTAPTATTAAVRC